MSGDPETISESVTEGGFGCHDIITVKQHIGNVDGSFDPVADFDQWRADRVYAVLMTEYPGHFWKVRHDLKQGMCFISIPILMGICNWHGFNLKTHGDLTRDMVKNAGGDILSRYRLRRGRLEIGSFLEARHKHSALVNRHRAVPA